MPKEMRGRPILLGALIVLAAGQAAGQTTVDGDWNHYLVQFGKEFGAARVTLESHGARVTGTLNELTLEGTIEGDLLRLTATGPGGEWGTFEGRVRGDEINGKILVGGEEYGWTARRAKVMTGPPRTHIFEAAAFHNAFSGAIDPTLHINPGDTVRTSTVDAGGADASDVTRALGGNPQTGPFYVEGAMPGDTLVVRLRRVRLNRDWAGSNSRILPVAVEAGYYRDAKLSDNSAVKWTLDRDNGVAMLAEPTERLKGLRVPLRPMLGCVGVAPPREQAFHSGWPGPWGGNVDYSGVREGTTVYLPVYQEGALLFVGDGTRSRATAS